MAQNGDMKAHERTYEGVISLLKWGTALAAVITLIVVLLIAR